jgi:hypothetical protein
MSEKVIENRIRRMARRLGHYIIKSRSPAHTAVNPEAGYMLVDDRRGCVLGSWHNATLDQIEAYLQKLDRTRPDSTLGGLISA